MQLSTPVGVMHQRVYSAYCAYVQMKLEDYLILLFVLEHALHSSSSVFYFTFMSRPAPITMYWRLLVGSSSVMFDHLHQGALNVYL